MSGQNLQCVGEKRQIWNCLFCRSIRLIGQKLCHPGLLSMLMPEWINGEISPGKKRL